MDPSLITTLALAGAGAVSTVSVWAHRQAGRITTIETQLVEREKLADERHKDLKDDLDVIRRALGVKDQNYNR